MTFIQPKKPGNGLLSLIFAVLAVVVIAGIFGMIALYNATVNLSHNIAAAKAQLDSIGARNTQLNDQILSLTTGAAFTDLAAADGLVQDKNPQYFTKNQSQQSPSWPLASH